MKLINSFDDPQSSEEIKQRKRELFAMWAEGWQQIQVDQIEMFNETAFRRQRMFELIAAGFGKAEQYRRQPE